MDSFEILAGVLVFLFVVTLVIGAGVYLTKYDKNLNNYESN
jgi:ABC-type phosphate transport system permease subunit